MNTISPINKVLPAFGADMRTLPQTGAAEVAPPEDLKTSSPKEMDAVSFSRPAAAPLEAPVNRILDVAVNGNTPIGTLSQLRSDRPEDFLTLMTKVLHSSGIGTSHARLDASYGPSQMYNAVTTTEAPIGAHLDVAA